MDHINEIYVIVAGTVELVQDAGDVPLGEQITGGVGGGKASVAAPRLVGGEVVGNLQVQDVLLVRGWGGWGCGQVGALALRACMPAYRGVACWLGVFGGAAGVPCCWQWAKALDVAGGQ
jgi:hypothetical protein